MLAIVLTLAVNLVVGSFISITLPSLIIPFSGLLVGGLRAVLWGLIFSPTTLAVSGREALYGMLVLVLLLLEGQGYVLAMLAAIAGEEAMFRGWMQTQLEACGLIRLSIFLPALLFGLRHLPLDLYQGHAGLAGWAVRLLELYGLALVMGFIRWRTGSIAPAVILHGFLWWLVIFSVYGTAVGALIGAIMGFFVISYTALTPEGLRI